MLSSGLPPTLQLQPTATTFHGDPLWAEVPVSVSEAASRHPQRGVSPSQGDVFSHGKTTTPLALSRANLSQDTLRAVVRFVLLKLTFVFTEGWRVPVAQFTRFLRFNVAFFFPLTPPIPLEYTFWIAFSSVNRHRPFQSCLLATQKATSSTAIYSEGSFTQQRVREPSSSNVYHKTPH